MHNTPPIQYLEVLSKECPYALQTYLQLWDEKDLDSTLCFSLEDLPDVFLMPKARILNHIRDLARSGLVSYRQREGVIHIEVVAWDPEDEL